jgi:hypothetical protein
MRKWFNQEYMPHLHGQVDRDNLANHHRNPYVQHLQDKSRQEETRQWSKFKTELSKIKN